MTLRQGTLTSAPQHTHTTHQMIGHDMVTVAQSARAAK